MRYTPGALARVIGGLRMPKEFVITRLPRNITSTPARLRQKRSWSATWMGERCHVFDGAGIQSGVSSGDDTSKRTPPSSSRAGGRTAIQRGASSFKRVRGFEALAAVTAGAALRCESSIGITGLAEPWSGRDTHESIQERAS